LRNELRESHSSGILFACSASGRGVPVSKKERAITRTAANNNQEFDLKKGVGVATLGVWACFAYGLAAETPSRC
jgi:hypothetical protein